MRGITDENIEKGELSLELCSACKIELKKMQFCVKRGEECDDPPYHEIVAREKREEEFHRETCKRCLTTQVKATKNKQSAVGIGGDEFCECGAENKGECLKCYRSGKVDIVGEALGAGWLRR
jgi:hypothetical protein